MSILKEGIEQADHDALVRIVVDTFRRIVFHYGAWFAEVVHQVGLDHALSVEDRVWDVSLANQIDRLGKTL